MNTLRIKSIIAVMAIVSISGCSILSLLGASIRDLQNQKVKYNKTFDKDMPYCYKNTVRLNKDMLDSGLGLNSA